MNAETTPESLEEINRLVETVFTCFKNSPIVLLPAVVLFLLVIKKVDVIPDALYLRYRSSFGRDFLSGLLHSGGIFFCLFRI